MDKAQEMRMLLAARDIFDERGRQHEKWGEQNHELPTWLMILGEEVGELNQAVLETYFQGAHGGISNIREEAVQVAAVACQIIEYIDKVRGEAGINEPDS
jgi:NTP pyrophosphatase (non-canonical NTP hydrolase)